ILDSPGVVSVGILRPLAYLGLARAYAVTGDKDKSLAQYRQFLALWRNADPDLRILHDAETEYAKLRSSMQWGLIPLHYSISAHLEIRMWERRKASAMLEVQSGASIACRSGPHTCCLSNSQRPAKPPPVALEPANAVGGGCACMPESRRSKARSRQGPTGSE